MTDAPLFDLAALDAVMRDHKRRLNLAVHAAVVALRKAGHVVRPSPWRGGYHMLDGRTCGNAAVLELAKAEAGVVRPRRRYRPKRK